MFALASHCSVLIVEDDLDTADLLRRYLKTRALSAEVVHNGRDALQFLQRQQPRCLILDEMMPEMLGLDLFRRMIASPEYRNIPVLFYSASYDWRKQMEAEALGAKGWFIKGVSSLDQLADQVQGYCAE